MTEVTTNDKLAVPKHRLRNGLEEGQLMLGTFSSLASAWAARIVAGCGWDYVIIDQEHGNHDDGDMHDTVNAVAAADSSPLVRIRAAEYGLIKRALDCGAHGIMVPMVNTAETARDIVQWAKFPPMGARGQGSSFSAIASGLSLPEYIRTANRTILTAVQIETPEAVANVDDIAAVDGIDALFIGPNDLALSLLGYVPARWDEQPFLEAIEKVREAGAKYGKHVGILAKNAVHARELAENDWTWVAIGTDVRALQEAMTKNIATARGQ